MMSGLAERPVIEIDGGVTPDNARALTDAGADVLVAGSAVFRGGVADNVRAFRDATAPTRAPPRSRSTRRRARCGRSGGTAAAVVCLFPDAS